MKLEVRKARAAAVAANLAAQAAVAARELLEETWCGHGQADLRHNGYGELPARPPHLSVDPFPLRYRVPDFVGGHLTGIMIAERRSNEQDICCHPVLQE